MPCAQVVGASSNFVRVELAAWDEPQAHVAEDGGLHAAAAAHHRPMESAPTRQLLCNIRALLFKLRQTVLVGGSLPACEAAQYLIEARYTPVRHGARNTSLCGVPQSMLHCAMSGSASVAPWMDGCTLSCARAGRRLRACALNRLGRGARRGRRRAATCQRADRPLRSQRGPPAAGVCVGPAAGEQRSGQAGGGGRRHHDHHGMYDSQKPIQRGQRAGHRRAGAQALNDWLAVMRGRRRCMPYAAAARWTGAAMLVGRHTRTHACMLGQTAQRQRASCAHASLLNRPRAATQNLDRWVVLGWDGPAAQFEEVQVSRFLVSAEAAGLPFSLCLNKADLVEPQVLAARVEQCR